ncbi:hypothetical protein [Nocardioides sp. SYSU DS0651]|uniref:hypothetical protein n=1 Tax=Nocardioides sp. SYSU DS0651 TaxID=3415955 RepID=UPI003F4B15A0
MGVHEELAELAAEVGAGAFDDAEVFRAVLDDYLADDTATRGEINVLVDAVRLGVFERLAAQVDNGADVGSAIDVLGDQLARDRGTSEVRSARWAIAALAYAVGRAGEDVVLARREAMERADDRPDRPPASATPPPAAPTTVAAPAAAGTRELLPWEKEERPERRGRVIAAVVAVVVLLAAAAVTLRAFDDGDGRDRESQDPVVAPPFTSAEVVGDRSRAEGVRSARRYRLTDRGVVSVVALTNTTRKPVTRLWAEVVPKEVADHVSKAAFKPRYTGVIEADPIVYWRIRLPAGATKEIRWSAALPDEAQPSAEYLNRVVGWHEEAVTGATPRIERALARLAREGESVIKPPPPALDREDVAASTSDPSDVAAPPTDEPVEDGPTEDDDPPPPPRNRAPRLSLASKTTDERVSASYAVNGSDPDGDSWSVVAVSGAPAGIGKSGSRSLGGTVSHTAAGVTVHKSSLRTRSFRVSVTIQDEKGARTTGSFTWTVRDTHRVMPRYVGCYGNGDCGAPDIGAFFSPSFNGCVDPGRKVDTVAKQSISPGTVVRWGSRATFWYVHAADHPPC